MRIHLATFPAWPHVHGPVDAFTALAAQDRLRQHELTSLPEEADAILFTQCHLFPRDWRLDAIRQHPLTKSFGHKVLVYDERDRPWCSRPGVYVSMPHRHFVPAYQRAWGYFLVPSGTTPGVQPDLLFSLVASASAKCRGPLFNLEHPNAVTERVEGFTFFDQSSRNFLAQQERFRSVLARSRFVLCPRGRGTSSIRLYETMAAGRVPVIISDDWVPPTGPDWEAFSIRWPEGSTEGLVDLLEERSTDWPRMCSFAHRAYREFFAPDVAFHHIATRCEELLQSGAVRAFREGGVRGRAYVESGADVLRWRASSAARRRVRSVLQRTFGGHVHRSRP